MANVARLLAAGSWLSRLAETLIKDDLLQPRLCGVQEAIGQLQGNSARADARPRTVLTPGQLLQRAQIERCLVGLVIELPEPLRTAILLRYAEGLPVEAIAKQQGLSDTDTQRLLAEAVGLLGHTMDQELSAAWRTAFLPLLR